MVLWIPALQSTNILLSLFPLDEVTPCQLTLMSDVIGSTMYMERERERERLYIGVPLIHPTQNLTKVCNMEVNKFI